MEWVIGASPAIDHISRWRSVVAKLLSITLLMVLIVVLRFWVRRKSLYREDWVILITTVRYEYRWGVVCILTFCLEWQLFSVTYSASCVIRKCDEWRLETEERTALMGEQKRDMDLGCQ